MIGGGFSDDAFRERVTYMVDRVAGSNPDRPVACITLYPHFRDFDSEAEAADKSARFRDILRAVVSESNHPNVTLIEGPEILADPGGLTVDLIHPGDLGMIQMGECLARRLAKILENRS